jgi:hypothetical protein
MEAFAERAGHEPHRPQTARSRRGTNASVRSRFWRLSPRTSGEHAARPRARFCFSVRDNRPPTLPVWGSNDESFWLRGAEAYLRYLLDC